MHCWWILSEGKGKEDEGGGGPCRSTWHGEEEDVLTARRSLCKS